jgi:phenylalanine-4-hydroxylase
MKTKEEEIKERIKNYQETIEILHRDIDELKLINQQATQEFIKMIDEFKLKHKRLGNIPEQLEELKQKLKEKRI